MLFYTSKVTPASTLALFSTLEMEQKILRSLQMEQNCSDLNTATKKYTQKKAEEEKKTAQINLNIPS
jgi:predicted secreted Zn-dependent protease